MINKFKNKCGILILGITCTILSNPVFAVDGLAMVKTKSATFVDSINQVLSPLGIGIATISVFVFGYQVSFGGKSPSAAAPILVGGLIIGAAAAIAGMITGNA